MNTIRIPNILLPQKGTDMNAYSVVACDQFTSQVEYWDFLKNSIGEKPSTFHMIFPEAYLDKVDKNEYTKNINSNIENYLKNGILIDAGECFILVERITSYGVKRLGLILSVDLEDYSYDPNSDALIRASEATIVERIPPRLSVRKDSPIELPHALLLFENKEKNIIENLYKNKEKYELVYDFDLNQNGGHIRGFKISNCEEVKKQFYDLYKKNNNGLLFVVGDGNHSLATAKAHWEIVKKTLSENEIEDHPARYALVEVNNVYDDGITFEPIHRVLFNINDEKIDEFISKMEGENNGCCIYKNNGKIALKTPKNAAKTYQIVQNALDEMLENNKEISIDFIHDEESLIEVVSKSKNAVGIVMPSIGKGDIFDFVADHGVLPRKSFSMGHASEKRYYLEAKMIRK
mgnify:CR=1 FL=1